MMKNLCYLFCLFLGTMSCSSADEIIFDIKNIKGKNSTMVENLIGKPDSTYFETILQKKYFIQRYKEYDTEIRHQDDEIKAIIVNKPFTLNFEPRIIEKFGFSYKEPSSQDTSAFFNWKNLEGIKNVSVYKIGMKPPHGVKTYFKIYFDME